MDSGPQALKRGTQGRELNGTAKAVPYLKASMTASSSEIKRASQALFCSLQIEQLIVLLPILFAKLPIFGVMVGVADVDDQVLHMPRL